MRPTHATRLLVVLLLAILSGCVTDPVVVALPHVSDTLRGVLVVNEGVWKQDNSTLTFYDPATKTAVQDYFAVKNPGRRIGDTGNDILVRGDRAFIPVTTSQSIEVLELPSGHSLGRVRIDGGGDPRHVAVVNDSVGFATLSAADAIIEFDPRTLTTRRRMSVGPAPEGIAADDGRVFVANSGYGYLRQSEAKAGTISVIDAASGSEITLISAGANVIDVHVSVATGRLYALYGMPDPDSTGGVVEYDLVTLHELRRWPVTGVGVAGAMAFNESARLTYVIARDGVMKIDLGDGTSVPELFVSSSEWTPLGFYGLGVSPLSGEVYISYVRGFTIPGEVLIYNRSGEQTGRFSSGLNPGTFGFY